jgi:hypothetical protein
MRVTVEGPDGHKVIIDPDEQRAALEKAATGPAEQWDGKGIAATMVKSAPERRFALYCAYPAMKADVTTAADGHRDFAAHGAIEDTCWDYTLKSRKIGLWHSDGEETVGAGEVVESYIYRNSVPWVIKAPDGSEHVIKAGDWMLGIRWGEAAWKDVRSGKINGVSMQGRASRRRPAPESLAQLRS